MGLATIRIKPIWLSLCWLALGGWACNGPSNPSDHPAQWADPLIQSGTKLYDQIVFNRAWVDSSRLIVEKHSKQLSPLQYLNLCDLLADQYATAGMHDSGVTYALQGTKIKGMGESYTKARASCYATLSYCYEQLNLVPMAASSAQKAAALFREVGQTERATELIQIQLSLLDSNQRITDENSAATFLQEGDTMRAVRFMLNEMLDFFEQADEEGWLRTLDTTRQLIFSQASPKTYEILTILSLEALQASIKGQPALAKSKLKEAYPYFADPNHVTESDTYIAVAAIIEARHPDPQLNQNVLLFLNQNKRNFELFVYYDGLSEELYRLGEYRRAVEAMRMRDTYQEAYQRAESKENILKLINNFKNNEQKQLIQSKNREITYKNTFIALLIALALVLFMIIVVIVVRYKQRRIKNQQRAQAQFTARLLENTEEERKRIAYELHDGINHQLISLRQGLKEPTHCQQVDQIIDEVRQVSRNLHPAMIETVGLKLSLEQLLDRINANDEFVLSSSISPQIHLTPQQELQLYRICQEALNNAIKYAKASAIRLELTEDSGTWTLSIKDNGVGFDVDKAVQSGESFGLQSMRERAKLLGAEVKINSTAKGTTVTVSF